jgi:hypothetical protein
MNTSDLAQNAHAFHEEFKTQILRQIDELNVIADGALQDGYSAWNIQDGWIALKGFSWGFCMHYDEPVRIDMTFGPGWPFVGYKVTFEARQMGDRMAWVNVNRPEEMLFEAEQLARYGLRKLACKAGDEWIFDSGTTRGAEAQSQYVPVHHDTFREMM